MTATLELSLNPSWEEIEKVREQTMLFLEGNSFTRDTVHSLIMIVSELTENAIKYGVFHSEELPIQVNVEATPTLLTVEVTNPIDASVMDHIKKLDRTIQWIRGYQDPFEAYVDKIKEISKKPLEDRESGLGLVRVAYEGKGIIDFYLTEDDKLSVSSVLKLEQESGPTND